MSVQRTLSIIKPDAVGKNVIGGIYAMLEEHGLVIVAAKMIHMNQAQAEGFYAEHKERFFFSELVEFMCSGPVMVQVLEGEDAIANYRKLMGATKPIEAEAGTIREKFATKEPDTSENAVHGSDSPESAEREINYFFEADEIHPRTR